MGQLSLDKKFEVSWLGLHNNINGHERCTWQFFLGYCLTVCKNFHLAMALVSPVHYYKVLFVLLMNKWILYFIIYLISNYTSPIIIIFITELYIAVLYLQQRYNCYRHCYDHSYIHFWSNSSSVVTIIVSICLLCWN